MKSVLDADPTAWAFALGDLTQTGKAIEYQQYYQSVWGSFRERTLFSIGNHDCRYTQPYGAAYYAYTGAPKYYAKTLGNWRGYFLNIATAAEGGANLAEQTAWLQADLARYSATHQIFAMFHYPMYSSVCEYHTALNGGVPHDMTSKPRVGPWWKLLQQHGCEFAVSGHAHRYERIAPLLAEKVGTQWTNGKPSAAGIRQFVVGTGGVLLRGILSRHPYSEKVVVEHGVMRYDLHADRYNWSFINASGVVRDSGSEICRKVLA